MKQGKEMMQIQVGVFVAVGLFLAMLVIFLLGSEKRLFEGQYSLFCRFEDISGLRVGAPVQLAGIQVGSVNEILFDESLEAKKVKLVLRIAKSYKDRIRKDSSATIMTQGLLGDKMIFISVGSQTEEVLADGGELATRSEASFTGLLEQGGGLLENLVEISENVQAISKEIKDGKGALHELIYDEKGEALMDDTKVLISNLKETSGHAKNITAKIDRGEGTLGALVNDATLFNDMKTLLGKANRNKLIRSVIRETLRTKEENLIKE